MGPRFPDREVSQYDRRKQQNGEDLDRSDDANVFKEAQDVLKRWGSRAKRKHKGRPHNGGEHRHPEKP
jgi:hypothetical protein